MRAEALRQKGMVAVSALALVSLMLTACAMAADAAGQRLEIIKAVRTWPSADYSRITIESANPLEFQVSLISDPNRVVLDMANVDVDSLRTVFASRSFDQDPHIKSVRVGRYKTDIARLVLDLREQSRPTTFALKPVGQYQNRLVLDVYPVSNTVAMPTTAAPDLLEELIRRHQPRSSTAASADVQPEPAPPQSAVSATSPAASPTLAAAMPLAPLSKDSGGAPAAVGASTSAGGLPGNAMNIATAALPVPSKPAQPQSAASAPAQSLPAAGSAGTLPPASSMLAMSRRETQTPAPKGWLPRTVVIVVDAGHGGEDPGAHGRRGTIEKDVTLAIAKKLKEAIDQQPMMRAVLTRDSDFFIPLRERVEKARSAQADLFVSVHADAFVKPDARGSSVFALSERGATSVSARWLARQENNADLIGGVSIDTRDPHLAQTLLDLSMTATISDSKRLAGLVLSELGSINRLHKNYVEQAGFAVLKSPDVPSILVETAFISNPADEQRLGDHAYQLRLAAAILSGIKRYFARNPPLARQSIASN